MRITNRRADAQSQPTTFSGLPKAAKLYLSAGNLPALTPGVFATFSFNAILFNYGGFTFTSGAAKLGGLAYAGIVIPEPGLYFLQMGWYVANTGGIGMICEIQVNGGNPPGWPRLALQDLTRNLGGTPSGVLELRAGDIVTATGFSDSAYIVANGSATLYVEKRGGQY